jgi:TolA-binding protein
MSKTLLKPARMAGRGLTAVNGPRAAGLLCLGALLLGGAVRAQSRAGAARTDPSPLYQTDLQLRGSVQLAKGDVEGAALTFCQMLTPPSGAEVWTLSVVLLCDPQAVWPTVKKVAVAEPVFVQIREFNGRKCYRVCAGLTLDRKEPLRWKKGLPAELLAEKPFPAKILFPCQTSGTQAEPTEKPAGNWEALEPEPVAPALPQPEPVSTPQAPAAPLPTPTQVAPAIPLPIPSGSIPAAKAPPSKAVPAEPSPVPSSSPAAAPPGAEAPPAVPRPASPSPASPASAATPPPPLTSPRRHAGAATPAPGVSDGKRKEAEVWFQKGVTAFNKGQRKEAETCYRQALKADPGRPEVMNNLGILYLEQNRFAEARDLFEGAISKSPAYSRAHLNLAGALWGLNQKDRAIQEAREASVLDPKDVNAHLTLASFLLAEDRRQEAALEARAVLALDSQNARAKVLLETAEK